MFTVLFFEKRTAQSRPFNESTEKSMGTMKLVMMQVLVISANLTKSADIYYFCHI
jgi:hypothetical protein